MFRRRSTRIYRSKNGDSIMNVIHNYDSKLMLGILSADKSVYNKGVTNYVRNSSRKEDM